MSSDRPFQCDTCEKSFKLNFHLKRHKDSCRHASSFVTCEECGKKLASKKVLKYHKASCNPSKVYPCFECDISFEYYSILADHRKKEHSKIVCDFCDHVCHVTNLKRHIKNKHKGLKPSTANKKVKSDKKNQCEKCEKVFYDKSTLNRHIRSHCFKCVLCDKIFSNKGKMEEHMNVHERKNEHTENKKRKTVSWSEQLENVKEIPISKAPLIKESVHEMIEIKKHTENALQVFKNRGQLLRIETLKDHIEKHTRKSFDDLKFKTMISIIPSHYTFSIFKNSLVVDMLTYDSPVTPFTLKRRDSEFRKEISLAILRKDKYVDLVSFPQFKKPKYKSAIELLKENVLSVSSDEDDQNDVKDANNHEKLISKVKKHQKKKEKRENKLKQIDFQKKRLPKLARQVNSAFVSEQKSCIKFERLLQMVEHNKEDKRSDLQRLVRETNGWLTLYKDWVKRKPGDINNICDSLS